MSQGRSVSLRLLFHAIATGDGATALRLIERSPALASEAMTDGATRPHATENFIEEIGHHVYTGDTALHIAAAAYRTDIARALVQNGANVRAANRRGAQPLHYASDGNPGKGLSSSDAQSAVIEYLVAAGADINAVDKSGVAPLHRAVRTRCSSATKTLLAHGAVARLRNGNGSTPLHLAVQNTGRGGTGTEAARKQQSQIIVLLVEHGARLTDHDGQGKSVFDRITADWIRVLVE